MSWTPKTITPPLPPGAVAVVSAISAATSTIGGVLSTVSALLNAAKIFFTGGTDLLQALMGAVISEAENLNNDFFGSGAFQLIISPFDLFGPRYLEDGNGKDQYKIPYLTPRDAISAAVRSLDDTGDINRPVFSDAANIAAFGLLVTAPDVRALISLMESLLSVWKLDDLEFIITRTKAKAAPKPKKSVPVDWTSLKFNQIAALGDIQAENNKALAIARGYLNVGDNVITQMIDTIQRKVSVLNNSVATFQQVINLLTAAAGIPNVFVLDVPLGPGGTRRLKTELRDANLESLLLNKYTLMLLYVGGGPSALGVDNIRKLMV